MLIARSPLRISLGGSGTDLPSYCADHGSFLIEAGLEEVRFRFDFDGPRVVFS